MKKQQTGFTLIELVVVILILSILAATALPRFMDIQDDAHEAGVAGAGGGFGAAVALVHAQWVANGSTGLVDNVPGFGAGDVDVNTAGWPTDTNGANTVSAEAHCVRVWNGIMQNPPTVATLASGSTTADYLAAVSGTECTYTYQGTGILAGVGAMDIVYESADGSVCVDDSLQANEC